jgi:hypothetical protein
LPPLYKYMDVRGAVLTLDKQKFRHAKPSDFNDREDLTIQSLFPDETEIALLKLQQAYVDVILEHINEPPTCPSPQKEMLARIQFAFQRNPAAAAIVKAELVPGVGKPIYNIGEMRTRSKEHVARINGLTQMWRVFCVTTDKCSTEMWTRYADNHKGIALRIEPSRDKDSKFQIFEPVIYLANRPPLYESARDFLASSLFGDPERDLITRMRKIIYTKTLQWEYEKEYRLAIPLMQDEAPWDTSPYNSEEITELYLGCNMQNAVAAEIMLKARRVNPAIAIFQGRRGTNGHPLFDRVED